MSIITKKPSISSWILFGFGLIALFVITILFGQFFAKENAYRFLFLLPLSFLVFSSIFKKVYSLFFDNLGVTIILSLYFVRMVISPLFMFLGNYNVSITYNVSQNTTKSILLICYEFFCVIGLFYILTKKHVNRGKVKADNFIVGDKSGESLLYMKLVLLILMAICICLIITPELIKIYRPITAGFTDKNFTSLEDSYIIGKYSVDFISKLSLVTGNYLMRAVLLILPATFIIATVQMKIKFYKVISLLFCTIPLFFVPGAIARSLIYVVILFILRMYLINNKPDYKIFIWVFAVCAIFVLLWWGLRSVISGSSVGLFEGLSSRISAYFSGVNIVSGTFNLPEEFNFKLRYFLYDFTQTMPYGNTIFNTQHEPIQSFFNKHNLSFGQIPTTIGMGYYYFGAILSPVYSIGFAYVAFICGYNFNNSSNPFQYIRLLKSVIDFSMGIIMYNIEITMTSFYTLLLPLYIMERICFKKENLYDKNNSLLLVWKK